MFIQLSVLPVMQLVLIQSSEVFFVCFCFCFSFLFFFVLFSFRGLGGKAIKTGGQGEEGFIFVSNRQNMIRVQK